MNVAVIGVGRMGRHHVRTYAQNVPQATLVGVVDFDLERAQDVAREYGTQAYPSVEALLAAHGDLNAVTVAVPTQHHVAAATPLLERRIACLIEKPLAPGVAAAQTLVDLARRTGAVLQVGHTERFNPAVAAVADMNLTVRYMEVNRVSPMTFRSLDVGVVMDMMIHDLDIVLSLTRSPIKTVDATGVAVLGTHEDIANARIVFESGCVASLTASRMALTTARTLRLFSESGYVSLDYASRSGVFVGRSANRDTLEAVRRDLAAGKDLSDTNYHDVVNVQKLTPDPPEHAQDQLTAQALNFLSAAGGQTPPKVTAQDGCDAVAAAERVLAAIAEHQWEGLDDSLFSHTHS